MADFLAAPALALAGFALTVFVDLSAALVAGFAVDLVALAGPFLSALTAAGLLVADFTALVALAALAVAGFDLLLLDLVSVVFFAAFLPPNAASQPSL